MRMSKALSGVHLGHMDSFLWGVFFLDVVWLQFKVRCVPLILEHALRCYNMFWKHSEDFLDHFEVGVWLFLEQASILVSRWDPEISTQNVYYRP